MGKWPGNQNAGNHFCRSECRKENNKQQTKKNEDSLRTLWDNIKYINICIIGVPEEEREKGFEKIFEEIKAENFPNMGKETVNPVQEVQKVSGMLNPRRSTLRHIVIKLTKNKDKDSKSNKKEKWQHTRELLSGYQLISHQKLYKPERNGTIYLK